MKAKGKRFLSVMTVLILFVSIIPLQVFAESPETAEFAWEPVGDAVSTDARNVSMDVYEGTPYVAYGDWKNRGKATVKKYDGTDWESVGSPGFSNGQAGYVSLDVYEGTPYVAYSDGENGYKATVKKYNGTNWENVGSAGFSNYNAWYVSIDVHEGIPYVAYSDSGNYYKATVKKYDGREWVDVGQAGFSSGDANYVSLDVYNGIPYVAYSDRNEGMVMVKKHDGGIWKDVDSPGLSDGLATYLSLNVYNGTPYLAYGNSDMGNGNKATVKKYDGGTWKDVGSPGFSDGNVWYMSLDVYNGTPYVAYGDWGNGRKATVRKYNGTDWKTVGQAEFSDGQADYVSLDVYNGIPYVAYRDEGNGGKATVMIYATYTMDTLPDLTLPELTAGYGTGTQETKTVTVTRTGTGDLSNLAVALSGTNADDFTITQPAATTLDVATPSTTFTVKAQDGLAAGTYTATVTVTADKIPDQTFAVTVTINPAPSGGGNSGGGSNPDRDHDRDRSDSGQTPPIPEQPSITLIDIDGHWAEAKIKEAVQKGLVSGYPDGTFRPDTPLTRLQWISILTKGLQLQGKGAPISFMDEDQIPAWGREALALAIREGIVSGYPDGSFRPDQEITRAEIVTTLARILKLETDTGIQIPFSDRQDIPAWASGSVAAMLKEGLIQGRGENQFAPKESTTRAEAVVLILNVLDKK